ncbi:dicarboxylate/amino acid:cation symporter [Paenibacillus thiaminolyticus]|uniref:Dicarboxylate/amino acid:cation symporter n=1 Tax=Paenibacillus thiaminolyticus TaxID=49283 RepID=A0AAP9J279_PANTH|nr:dicarboxylate/amino acid:cation symporter [Paenibacillus thiaminolyticus]MCY9534342.1 dicarboxylate/amino acid:cation symporter [Paenibacillus thiaminolyticus]MCY9602870.1 dicarboxylate/amino acid:cation symporter [Paenibacillus thiaminolyticus]MCY9608284.1 dicarboxylate/amino acid:cation symporter [Paenibacillus thiaminolyticus]MCY9614431.1 dicarboxylate/amino acid:cation symporter [Paenibacillus thiaminolyticus]MCY9618220.1 dicarboxylate/amino acid:cation symporter [Paenibacillus thiamino
MNEQSWIILRDWNVYASWGVALLLVILLWWLAKKKVGFGLRVLLAMALGLTLGALFGPAAADVSILGSLYVSLIKMVVMPLVFAAIITSITSVKDPAVLKKLGTKTIALFLITTAIAAVIGLGTALVIDPGSGIAQNGDAAQDFQAREIPSFRQVILDLVPSNPINEMAQGKVVPVIIFAAFIAVAIIFEGTRNPERVQPVRSFFQSFSHIMFRVTKFVIRLTPYGVLGLMTSMSAKYGLSTLKELGWFIIAVYAACLIHMIITFGSLVAFGARVNPIRFFKKAYPTMAVAFTTRSSYATLPVNLEVITKRMKVSDRIASFVAPLGATINMNGCGGIYPAVVAVFIARVYGIDLNIADYLLIIGAATLASVGVAGVPGPASISTTVVLVQAGLPLEGFALVLGVDAIVDMARTTVNATGTTVASLLVASSEGEFDREAFHHQPDGEIDFNTESAPSEGTVSV